MMDNASDFFGWRNAEWLTRMLRRSPEGLLLLGAGVLLLMRDGASGSARAPRSGELHGASEALSSGAAPAGDAFNRGTEQASGMLASGMRQASESVNIGTQAAREAIHSGAQAASEAMNMGREAITGGAQQASATASAYFDSASHYARSAADTIAESSARLKQQTATAWKQGNAFMRNQPLAIVALGLGAGMALAAMLPASEIEERMMGPARERLADTARGAGERVARATSVAGSELVHSIGRHGLNESGVKEMVSEVASSFTGALADHDRAQAAHDAAQRQDGAPQPDMRATS